MLAASVFSRPAHASDSFASLPYRSLLESVTTFLDAPPEKRSRLALLQRLRPDGDNLVARPLTMTIQAKSGPIEIPVADDNSFVLPVDDRLKDENPPVITNQPKGTLSLQVGVRILLPQTTHYAYSEFAEGVRQANAMTKRFAGMLWLFSQTADSVILRFYRPERQMLRIAAADGALTLIADDSGTIFVRLDKKLIDENPMMDLSEPALDALPAVSSR
ncbi:hypothetical protein GCM10011611_35290 [Aliidongia dinghuensis]|uniref:Uncharacterized protein n=1 Tax=Aliidongia dinghuensis TaxID=1867774 RepID=A0A8J2YW22_9PROT|nr:DUF2987 domain-containing protein [Aliidongia dinghuensis]GGF26171.1 hypothetical protein GCM10011611_35290 [Aliidongia dinghuensis]